MLVRRDAAVVRLFTRNGHDWTGRFPLIARAASGHAAAAPPSSVMNSRRFIR
jgi:ATP-dependent DNA ligase